MSRRPHPPTPMPARRLWRRLNRLSITIFLLAATLALVAWARTGDTRAFLFVGPAVLLLATTLTHRMPVLQQTLLLGTFASVGWLFGQPLIGLAGGVAYLVFVRMRSRSLPPDLTVDSLVELPTFLVGPGAEGFVKEFLHLGYEPAGAIGFPAMGNLIVASILLGPGGDRYCTVTDAILTVTTRFGGRTLVTRNSALSRMAPHALDNPLRGATPAELDRSHTAVLEMLRGKVTAETLRADETTPLAVGNEQQSIAWVREQRDHRLPGGGLGAGPLTENPDADALVSAWLAAEPASPSSDR